VYKYLPGRGIGEAMRRTRVSYLHVHCRPGATGEQYQAMSKVLHSQKGVPSPCREGRPS
jgi:hypothetical protein